MRVVPVPLQSLGRVLLRRVVAPVAMANGYPDGEKISLDDALVVAGRILEAIDIPLTMDLEGGYGPEPDVVAQTVSLAMDTE